METYVVRYAVVCMQARIIERTLTDDEIDSLALMAVAGIAAEGQMYEEVRGATLFSHGGKDRTTPISA